MATVQSHSELPGADGEPQLGLESDDLIPSRSSSGSIGYQIVLEMRPELARVTLSGVLDESSADAVGGMISADGPVTRAVELCCGSVTTATESAMELLVATAREREQHGLPPVTVVELSESVAAALRAHGLGDCPPVFLADPIHIPSMHGDDQEDRCV